MVGQAGASGQGQNLWVLKSGLRQREGRTVSFSGDLGPGKGGWADGRKSAGGGWEPRKLWKTGRWGPAAWPSRIAAEVPVTRGGGGKGGRGEDGGVASPHRNLALAGPLDLEEEAALHTQ